MKISINFLFLVVSENILLFNVFIPVNTVAQNLIKEKTEHCQYYHRLLRPIFYKQFSTNMYDCIDIVNLPKDLIFCDKQEFYPNEVEENLNYGRESNR